MTNGDGDGMAVVTLDGSRSFDPDGLIDGWVWWEGSHLLAAGRTASVSLPLGPTPSPWW